MKRRTKSFVALLLGAVVLTTSALADVVLGSGYLSLKEDLKTTGKIMSEDVKSYTMTMNASLKEGNRSYLEVNQITKSDFENNKYEHSSTEKINNTTESEYYNYESPGLVIFKSNNSFSANIYKGNDHKIYRPENPFEDEYAKDIEKVADSFVGSLQDVIQMDENDGNTLYTCNLDASQVPVYINALLSMGIKYSIFDEYQIEKSNLPPLTDNFYISNGSGKLTTDENGLLRDIAVCGEFSGTEKTGQKHIMRFEILISFTDINSTIIGEPPSLEGAEINEISPNNEGTIYRFPQRMKGHYIYPVIETTNNNVVKIGEKHLIIEQIDSSGVTGRIYELDADGNIVYDYNILAEHSDTYGAIFTYEENGETKNGIIDGYDDLSLCVSFDVEFTDDNGMHCGEYCDFYRVFE